LPNWSLTFADGALVTFVPTVADCPFPECTAIVVALSAVPVPLKVTVLVPCVAPKFVPVIVTGVATGPELGLRLVTVGPLATVTVNVTPLLA